MVENRAGRRICIIHAGMPKTGSSALQSFLARGARRLRRRGMLYPRTGLTWSSPGHHDLLREIAGEPVIAGFERLPARLDRELAARRHDVLILSSEAISGIVFYHYRLKLVEHFRQRGYAIHLVLYLRDSPEFLNAAYQQNTRMMREARSFHDYVAFTALGSGGPRPVLRLTGRLDDRLRAAGRLHFRPYDAALREKGIEQDFVDLLNTVCRDEGTATADAPLSVRDVATPRRLNEGCGPLQIEVSRRIAAALLERYPRRLLVQASHGQSHADQVARGIRRAGIREPSYWGFGPELYHRVREALAEENERFAQAVWERSWDAIFPPRPDERLVSNDLVDAGTDEMRALADRLHARIAPSIEAKVARRVARLKPSER